MRKVRILREGGTPSYYNKEVFNTSAFMGNGGTPNTSVNQTLKPVDREEANVEVEKGEIVVTDSDGNGFPELYKVKDKTHAEGGVPLNLNKNSFVFCKNCEKITDEAILKEYNMKPSKKGYAPAEIAKKFVLNDFQKVINDANSDKMALKTAELNFKNANLALGKLAILQESTKGFPQGVPFIAMPYLEKMGMSPEMFIPQNTEPTMQARHGGTHPMMKNGGGMRKVRIVKMPEGGGFFDISPVDFEDTSSSPMAVPTENANTTRSSGHHGRQVMRTKFNPTQLEQEKYRTFAEQSYLLGTKINKENTNPKVRKELAVALGAMEDALFDPNYKFNSGDIQRLLEFNNQAQDWIKPVVKKPVVKTTPKSAEFFITDETGAKEKITKAEFDNYLKSGVIDKNGNLLN